MNKKKKKTSKSTERKSRGNWFTKSIVVVVALFMAYMILKISPNYKNEEYTDRTNVIINNSNVTKFLKNEAYIDEKGNLYLSKQDIDNFFDSNITYDEKYNQIITTYGNNVAALVIGKNEMEVNSSKVRISAPVIEKNNTYYLPISEMKDVYDAEIEYKEDTNIITIDSKDRKQVKADCSKDINVKSRTKSLSRILEKVKKGDKVIVIDELKNGWAKIRTKNGKIGYVEQKYLANKYTVREDMDKPEKLEKVSLVWDYYSEEMKAPNRNEEKLEGINVVSPTFFSLKRLGEGEIIDKVGEEGIEYISWAQNNGYKVWGLISNEAMIETTSQILKDYKLREKTINEIVNLAIKYNLDGINLDFENMYKEDKDLFTRFVVELYPRLKQCGKTFSVDVTAPDGADTWSLCFDRYNIGKNCDYLIFMGYEQYGESSTTAGSTAAYDWIEISLKKIIDRDEVKNNKVVLGIPFYTRIWTEYEDGKLETKVISMKDVNNTIEDYFQGVQKVWNEGKKQYYLEKNENSITYKMWIEDEKSIQEKLNMAQNYKLGGVAFWVKDREDKNIWSIINNYLENKEE